MADPLNQTTAYRPTEGDTLLCGKSKREVKAAYVSGDVGLSDAVPALMFDHDMSRGEAFRYLGL